MDKDRVLGQLRAAKAAHISWVQRAKMLIEGVSIDEKSIPVNSTECQFGKWFYSDGQSLNTLRNNPIECMSEIEDLHFKLHDIYLHIFKIYYETDKKGFFAKLFGKQKKVTVEDRTNAKQYYDEMNAVSKELVGVLNRMERRISVLSEAELRSL